MYSTLEKYFKFEDVPKIGTVVVANFHEDRRWYRARVLNRSVRDMEVDVFFIDFGNIEKHVPLKRIRKLETTFSSQFSSFMKSNFLQGQAALFAYIGAAPVSDKTCPKALKKLDHLLLKHPFEFQVLEVPLISDHLRNEFHVRIPLYLVRSNPFLSTDRANYQQWLENNLFWRESTFEKSIELIKNELADLNPQSLNVQIMMPLSLVSIQTDRKRYSSSGSGSSPRESKNNGVSENGGTAKHKSAVLDTSRVSSELQHQYESDSEDRRTTFSAVKELQHQEYQKQQQAPGHEDVEDDGDDGNRSSCSVNDPSDNEQPENALHNGDKTQDGEESKQVVEVNTSEWKTSKKMLQSRVPGLDCYFPLPEEDVFSGLVSTLMLDDDDNMFFYINVCQAGISDTFHKLEKALQQHYLLCHDSMLKQYLRNSFEPERGTLCLCAFDKTFYRCLVEEYSGGGVKANVHCIDIGDEISVDKEELLPISDQFVAVPQFAIQCRLAGVEATEGPGRRRMTEEFNRLVEKHKYEVLLAARLTEREASDQLLIQPVPVEVFVVNDGSEEYVSLNVMLHAMRVEDEPGNVSQIELNLDTISEERDQHVVEDADADTDSDVIVIEESDGEQEEGDIVEKDKEVAALSDFYLRENIYHGAEYGNKRSQKPVCEYFRRKGKCFKGKKCEDRHVMHSDDEDDEGEDDNDMNGAEDAERDDKMLGAMAPLLSEHCFKRTIRIGTVLGIRVTAIYKSSIFYGYLTHGIQGFDSGSSVEDLTCSDGEADDETDGAEYSSIHAMEDDLAEFLKFEPRPIGKDVDLVKGSIVAVRLKNRVHRATIMQQTSTVVYEVQLLDFGITCSVEKRSLFFLPKRFFSRFRQQCFMFKLKDVVIPNQHADATDNTDTIASQPADQYAAFVEWFYDKVNDKILHVKVLDCYDESLYVVDLYNFTNDGVAAASLNSQAQAQFCN